MDEQLIMAHEERVKNTRNRTIAIIGIPTIVAGYSIYSIGKLPDMIPRERLYVSSALILGLGTAYSLAMAGNKNATSVIAFSGGTIGYALARGLFKQNVKTSLIAGLVVAGAYYFYSNKKKAEYAQQKRKEEEDNLLLNTGVKAIPK
jgi:cbb3-type cytochrome oxidase subunit 3